MKCLACNHLTSKVLESRSIEDHTVTKRRRQCPACGARFTTYEQIEITPLIVIKKNGTRELFEREKILRGLQFAFRKRPTSLEELENIARSVEVNIHALGMTEVQSSFIGETVLDKIKAVDEVAYVRFASIYRQFNDANSFIKEIKKLK